MFKVQNLVFNHQAEVGNKLHVFYFSDFDKNNEPIWIIGNDFKKFDTKEEAENIVKNIDCKKYGDISVVEC